MAVLIRAGRLVDVNADQELVCSMYVEKGKETVVFSSEIEAEKFRNETIKKKPVCEINAQGYYVIPGLLRANKKYAYEGENRNREYITIVDPSEIVDVNVDYTICTIKKSPLNGKKIRGVLRYTIADGEIIGFEG